MMRNKPAALIVLALLALAILMSLAALPAAVQDSSTASISHMRAQFDGVSPTPTASGSGASGGGNGGG